MEFKSVFKTMFPFISAAASVGGPIGIMAAAAVGNALGIDKVDSANLEDTITKAQIKDPDALVKLQQGEQQFKAEMTKLGFDNAEKLEQIAAEDRANARAREVAVKDKTNRNLAYITVAGFFGIVLMLSFRQVPERAHDLLLVLLGVLAGSFKDVYSYFFGSSSGSAQKTETLSKIATAS